MTTLREALTLAAAYWDTKGGSTGTVMEMRARKCVELGNLSWDRPVNTLGAADATAILTGIRRLSLSSRATYYQAFKRMCNLAGKSTHDWPTAGTAPRRVREPMPREHAEKLLEWFKVSDMPETADLLTLLLGTGMRVKCEALSFDAADEVVTKRTSCGDPVGFAVKVSGKGGHERVIPVTIGIGGLLAGTPRGNDLRNLSYSGHLKRWHRGVEALGIKSLLPTPHSIRHLYATEAYARSGGNLHVVRELLGHADINTTARYIGVNMEELRHAAGA
jgi:integrase